MTLAPQPGRQLPLLNEMNRYFWQSGAEGTLQILRCGDCGRWIHPYAAACPKCRSAKVAPEPVSGRGVIVGYTVNHHPWQPDVPVPYVVALVELEEQSNVRLVTNVANCPVEAVHIGMAVEVCFEDHDDVQIPLFQPRSAA